MSKNYYLLIFISFLFSLQLPLTKGIYFSTICFFLYFLYLFFSEKVSKKTLNLITIVIGIFLLNFIFHLFSGHNIEFISLLVPVKILLVFFISALFTNTYKDEKYDLNLLITVICIPIFISLIMYNSPSADAIFSGIYNAERYPYPGRYGGIYGRDVNSFGMYSTLVFLLINIFYFNKRINTTVYFTLSSISIIAIFISGSRTGLLISFPIIFYLLNGNIRRVFDLKYLKQLFISVIIITLILVNYNEYFSVNSNVLDSINNRFSFDMILKGIDPSSQGEGAHLASNIALFDEMTRTYEFNLLGILFGEDLSFNFVDNLYGFIFVRHGILITLAIVLIFFYAIATLSKRKKFLQAYFILFAMLISLKGVFILGEYFIFIATLFYLSSEDIRGKSVS